MARQIRLHASAVLQSQPFWLILLALVTYGRIWQIRDVIWDDNAWLLSIYSTQTLHDFLKIGFHDLRREPLGVALYYLFSLYRDTDVFFLVWHGLDLFLAAMTPVFLYLLILRVFKDRRLAFFSGIALIVFPLDYTMGFASAINYRIALFLTMASLTLSVYMVKRALHRRLLLVCSLFAAGLSQYVFLEASLTLEPARLLMFAYMSGGAQWYRSAHLRSALRKWTPFLLLPIPLIVYKLSASTSGIHAGLYHLDIHHLIDARQYALSLAHFLFFPWVVLGLNADSLRSGTVFAAIVAAFLLIIILHRMTDRTSEAYRGENPGFDAAKPVPEWTMSHVMLFVLVMIVPVFLLFQLAGRPISWGIDSSHAALCQPGYALLWGSLFTRLLANWQNKADWHDVGRKAFAVSIGLIAGIGIFFSNLNIDQYYRSWQEESRFLGEFLGRFPQLPERAFMIMDAHGDDLYSDINLYDIEFPLNLLYARTTSSTDFYRHKIITAEDFRQFAAAPVEAQRSGKIKIMRASDYGVETVDINRLIFVYYRDGRLLVNREIAEKFPAVSYRSWLDRKLPGSSPAISSFPLRQKFVFAPRLQR